jgi:hypothetical protein
MVKPFRALSRLGVVAALAVAGPAGLTVQQSGSALGAADRITAAWVEPHVRFLADSLLEGRDTASRGHEIAARYVAAQFAAFGLKPLLPSGFLQSVPLQQTDVDEDATVVLHGPHGDRALALHKDFFVHPAMRGERMDITAPLVFVGYGLALPALGYDDYAGIDVHGKIVVMLPGAPQALSGDERAVWNRLPNKERFAMAHGAAGIITVIPARVPLALSEERQYRQLDRFAWLAAGGEPHSLFLEQGAVVRLARPGAEALFEGASHAFADVQAAAAKGAHGFDLGMTATIHVHFHRHRVQSPNVAAVLQGSDSSLRNEYVVYTAHLDHEGIGPPMDGDPIYHGALDNAGGVATILAVARAFAAEPAPRRSIVFVAVTGEEKGLVGSDFFVNSGVVSADRIVADVNCDNFLWLGPLKDVFASGAQYSTLKQDVSAAAADLALTVSADPVPEQGILARSDHYSFLVHGVPSLSLINGVQSGDGSRSGTQLLTEWLRDVHHTPRDTIDQAIDWDAAVTCARLNFLIGKRVANAADRPAWIGHPFFLASR